jgi:hypothetical protein
MPPALFFSVLLGVELLESTFNRLRRDSHANQKESDEPDIFPDKSP